MKEKSFRPIAKKDRMALTTLLSNGLRGGTRWIALDHHWKRMYGYALRVQLIFDFIEQLIVPSGRGEGEPFLLRDFQKEFIKSVYNPVDKNNTRTVRRAILSMARKNGKTALIATLALVHLIGPEAINNGEIYCAANEREQASIIFKYSAQMVRRDTELMSMLKVVDSTKTMVCFHNGSIYRALSAEAGTKFGLNPSVVIYDELAQARNRELYDALDTAGAARLEPLFITISTQSNDPQHILSQMIDDGLTNKDKTTVVQLHAVPEDLPDEDIYKKIDIWKMANPALGDFRSLSEMKTACKRALRMPSFEAPFRNLYLNQRIDVKSPLISRLTWMKCKSDEQIPEGSPIYCGLDLSRTTDLTALVAVSAGDKDIVKAWFWKPENTLKEHERTDRVPYWVWKKMGFIETTAGNAIELGWVATRLSELSERYKIIGVAYDRAYIKDFLSAMDRVGVEGYRDDKKQKVAPHGDNAIRMVDWGQGFMDMAPAVNALEISILNNRLNHDGNPVLTWNISNAIAVSDPAGNRKIDKSKTRFRIDGATALIMALGLKNRDLTQAEQPSIYESQEVRTY
jgi:phage terminase large subunit-like protein